MPWSQTLFGGSLAVTGDGAKLGLLYYDEADSQKRKYTELESGVWAPVLSEYKTEIRLGGDALQFSASGLPVAARQTSGPAMCEPLDTGWVDVPAGSSQVDQEAIAIGPDGAIHLGWVA